MAVPWKSGALSAPPTASNEPTTAPSRSGCLTSTAESMTATTTSRPCASSCAPGSSTFRLPYCGRRLLGPRTSLTAVSIIELHLPHPTVARHGGNHLLLRPPVPDAEQSDAGSEQRNRLGAELVEPVLAGEVGLDGSRLILVDQHDELAGDGLLQRRQRPRRAALTAPRHARQVALAFGSGFRNEDARRDARPLRFGNLGAAPIGPARVGARALRLADLGTRLAGLVDISAGPACRFPEAACWVCLACPCPDAACPADTVSSRDPGSWARRCPASSDRRGSVRFWVAPCPSPSFSWAPTAAQVRKDPCWWQPAHRQPAAPAMLRRRRDNPSAARIAWRISLQPAAPSGPHRGARPAGAAAHRDRHPTGRTCVS